MSLGPFLEKFRQTLTEWEGFGLAAIQVGVDKQIIAVNRNWEGDQEDIIILFNPTIVRSTGHQLSMEGCLSVPFLQAEVDRFNFVEIKARTPDWLEITWNAGGVEAACLQHEIDHLNGVLLVDHISALKRDIYERKLKKLKRKNR